MKIPMNAVTKVVELLLRTESKRATKYLAPDLVISAQYHGKFDKRDRSIVVVLKLGKPNYAEREFIKQCKKASEPFPVKKVHLKAFKKNK